MKLRLNFKLIRSLIVLAALPLVGCTSGQFRKETSGSSGGGAGKSLQVQNEALSKRVLLVKRSGRRAR